MAASSASTAAAIYSRLTFTVRAQGDLAAIVEFLERFYEAPILHQIKNIALQRPQTVGPQQRPNDLECNLTIEALIVTGVENRPQLLPNVPSRLLVLDTVAALGGGPTGLAVAAWAAGPGGPLGPGMLAEPERDYTAVAARNIFFGRQAMPARSNEYGDVLRFIHLTDITRTEKKLEAFLYGRSDKRRTRLWPSIPRQGQPGRDARPRRRRPDRRARRLLPRGQQVLRHPRWTKPEGGPRQAPESRSRERTRSGEGKEA